MMFSCYVHGWHSHNETCPKCCVVITHTTSDSIQIQPTVQMQLTSALSQIAEANERIRILEQLVRDNTPRELVEQIEKLEAALQEIRYSWEWDAGRNCDNLAHEALTSLAAWKKENLR